jgi:hypothetical protein
MGVGDPSSDRLLRVLLERDGYFSEIVISPQPRRWSMIFSANRYPPRIKSGAGFFGIMLYAWAVRLITAVIKPGNASATANRLNVIIVIMTKLPFVGPGNHRRRERTMPNPHLGRCDGHHEMVDCLRGRKTKRPGAFRQRMRIKDFYRPPGFGPRPPHSRCVCLPLDEGAIWSDLGDSNHPA